MNGITTWYKVRGKRNADFRMLAPYKFPTFSKWMGKRGIGIFQKLDDLNVLVLILSAKVIDADGLHHFSEKKYVLDFYKKHYPEIPTKDIKYILERYLTIALNNVPSRQYNSFELPFICGLTYRYAKSKNIRAAVIYYLFEIVCADDNISSEESRLLREICYRVGFKKKVTDSFFAYFKGEEDIFDYTGNLKRKKKAKARRRVYSSSKGNLTIAYQILGLSRNATISQIKTAYRNLVKENHPDRFASLGKFHVEKATERISKINKAYEYIQSVKKFS